MEKEVVHLLEWIIEYPGVWQIVCNPDGKETSPESFKMAYDMLVKKSLFYLIPVLFATHPGEESLEMAKNLCTADSAAREIRKNGIGALVKCINQKTFPLPDSFRLHNQLPTNLIHKVKIK